MAPPHTMQLAGRADWALMIAIHDTLRRDLDQLLYPAASHASARARWAPSADSCAPASGDEAELLTGFSWPKSTLPESGLMVIASAHWAGVGFPATWAACSLKASVAVPSPLQLISMSPALLSVTVTFGACWVKLTLDALSVVVYWQASPLLCFHVECPTRPIPYSA